MNWFRTVSDKNSPIVVALLELEENRCMKYLSCLSSSEQEKFNSIKHNKRKREWLAARLAAKYLYLSRSNVISTSSNNCWTPVLLKTSYQNLDEFSPWMYRQVEILSDSGQARPGLKWRGKTDNVNLSLSHKDNIAAAGIAENGSIGLDVEAVVDRQEIFYSGNFTNTEKIWIANLANKSGIAIAWLFTLLWTVKESMLKSINSESLSILDFPSIEVEIMNAMNNFWSIYSYQKVAPRFFLFETVITVNNIRKIIKIAISGSQTLIITVLKV